MSDTPKSDASLPPAALSPALTSDEWISAHRRIAEYEGAGWKTPEFFLVDLARWYRGEPMSRESTHLAGRHVLAALCLYGTPEGFTHEDVSTLEWQADALERRIAAGGPTEPALEKTYRPHILALRSISLRIKSLLPPAPSHSEP